jgi:hypothetical protein
VKCVQVGRLPQAGEEQRVFLPCIRGNGEVLEHLLGRSSDQAGRQVVQTGTLPGAVEEQERSRFDMILGRLSGYDHAVDVILAQSVAGEAL